MLVHVLRLEKRRVGNRTRAYDEEGRVEIMLVKVL